MEKIAAFVNDIEHAKHVLQPLVGVGATHWILVACPPRLTRHIGRWVSAGARDQWRERWASELFAQLEPMLKTQSACVIEKLVARRPLADVTNRLQLRLGAVRLLDARQPALGRSDEPITAAQPPDSTVRWAAPVAVATGLSAVLAMAD